MKISLLINMKMPTIVGIFIFISRENFMLSWFEHENSFITLMLGDVWKGVSWIANRVDMDQTHLTLGLLYLLEQIFRFNMVINIHSSSKGAFFNPKVLIWLALLMIIAILLSWRNESVWVVKWLALPTWDREIPDLRSHWRPNSAHDWTASLHRAFHYCTSIVSMA